MRIAITGGAGFIGSNLVAHLRSTLPGAEIVVVDNLVSGRLENLSGLDVDFWEGTILDLELLKGAFKGVDSVVHLAALGSVPRSVEFPLVTYEANVSGTLMVLEAARELDVNSLVFASSSSVYGSNPELPKRETGWTRPISPYGASKLAAENYVLSYGFSYGLPTQVFRFFNVFGPLQRADHPYAAVIPRFVADALSSRCVTIFGDGSQTRDFTFVGSVCEVIAETITNQLSSASPVNLAFGTQTSLLELVSELEFVLGFELETIFEEARSTDVRHSQADTTLFDTQFPGISGLDLREGLRKTVDWALENRATE